MSLANISSLLNKHPNTEALLNQPISKESPSTPLIQAILKSKPNSYAIVEVLIEKGADPNVADLAGNLPIVLAVTKFKQLDLLRVLLQHEAIQIDVQM